MSVKGEDGTPEAVETGDVDCDSLLDFDHGLGDVDMSEFRKRCPDACPPEQYH